MNNRLLFSGKGSTKEYLNCHLQPVNSRVLATLTRRTTTLLSPPPRQTNVYHQLPLKNGQQLLRTSLQPSITNTNTNNSNNQNGLLQTPAHPPATRILRLQARGRHIRRVPTSLAFQKAHRHPPALRPRPRRQMRLPLSRPRHARRAGAERGVQSPAAAS